MRGFWEWSIAGGATLVLYPLSFLLRRVVGLDAAELAVGFLTFHAAYVVNDPHFCVTYLLFYRDARARARGDGVSRAQRVRWWLAGVLGPVALAMWAAVAIATRSAQTLGWMVQLMFLLVGWHYVKQGFGVLTVLASRRGVAFAPRERAALLAHAYLGWAFAWANPSMPAGDFEEKGIVFWAPAHPRALEVAAGGAFLASAVVLAVMLVARRARGGAASSIPWAPLGAFLVTVWAWTIFSAIDPIVRYMIPALHSVQYLYFVALLRGNQARAEEGPPTFGRPARVRLGLLAAGGLALGFLLLRFVPGLLDAIFVPRPRRGELPGPLGETPFFAAFYVVVNVHHYLMDAVIWRRDNPETRWLRVGAPPASPASPASP